MTILGLDISTSCTGWCITTPKGKLIDMGYVPLTRIGSVLCRADMMKHSLEGIKNDHQIKRIVIEENLQAFRPGFSSAKTLMSLARFNGIVSYICREVFELDPEYINVNVARRSIGLKIDRKSSLNTKDQVLSWVTDQLKTTSHQWPVKVLKSGPRKGQSVPEPGCYDMADAFVICSSACV